MWIEEIDWGKEAKSSAKQISLYLSLSLSPVFIRPEVYTMKQAHTNLYLPSRCLCVSLTTDQHSLRVSRKNITFRAVIREYQKCQRSTGNFTRTQPTVSLHICQKPNFIRTYYYVQRKRTSTHNLCRDLSVTANIRLWLTNGLLMLRATILKPNFDLQGLKELVEFREIRSTCVSVTPSFFASSLLSALDRYFFASNCFSSS